VGTTNVEISVGRRVAGASVCSAAITGTAEVLVQRPLVYVKAAGSR
jgi:hypothetical protein